MKKILSVILTILILISSLLAFDVSALDTSSIDTSSTLIYSSELINGKIFYKGENVEVNDTKQFDTNISDVQIKEYSDLFMLTFTNENNTINIKFIPISAKSNNKNEDHYVFSPIEFENAKYELINISFTTCANEFDLFPVNNYMIDKCVLSIIFKDKSTTDVYYWQGVMNVNIKERVTFDEVENIACENNEYYENLRENANEFYYMSDSQEFVLTQEEHEDQVAEMEAQQSNKITSEESNIGIKSITSHNYFYDDYGVPDSAFQTVTNYWSGGLCDTAPLDRRYVTYSYQLYGSNNVRTHTMIFELIYNIWDDGYISNHNVYGTHSELEIKILENETVIYYPSENLYDLTFDNNVVELYPSIEIKKTGGDIGQVAVAREFRGCGYSNSGGIASGLLNIIAGVIDNVATNGWVGTAIDILNLTGIGSEPYSFGSNKKTYQPTATLQEAAYGSALGSLKAKMDGYLLLPQEANYFAVTVWFNAPTQVIARKTTWVLYYSLDRNY